jgi:hypothetical protein
MMQSFPAQINDVKSRHKTISGKPVRFIRWTAISLVLPVGPSGGHLSALTGTTNALKSATINGLDVDIEGNLGEFTQASSKVNACSRSCVWAYRFFDHGFLRRKFFSNMMMKIHLNLQLIGVAIQKNKDRVALANPNNYANRSNPPFLIFPGDEDAICSTLPERTALLKTPAGGCEK